MSLFTLAQADKLGLDDLQAGLAETVITVSDVLSQAPVVRTAGNAYVFNREKQGVDGQLIAADGTITPSSALQLDQIKLSLQGISGQHDILRSMLRAGNTEAEVVAYQSAVKGVGRAFESLVLTGTVAGSNFDGLNAALASDAFASQMVDADSAALSFDFLDDAMSRVVSKGRTPDFIMGNAKAENKIKALLRSAGGTSSVEINGRLFQTYDGVPFLRNDFIPTVDGETTVYAGNWETGSQDGLALVVPEGDIFVADAPMPLTAAGKYVNRYLVVMMGALAIHNVKGIAAITNVAV